MIGLVFGFFGALVLLFVVLMVGARILTYLLDLEESWWLWTCGVVLVLKLFGAY